MTVRYRLNPNFIKSLLVSAGFLTFFGSLASLMIYAESQGPEDVSTAAPEAAAEAPSEESKADNGEQGAYDLFITRNGRQYALWEGVIMEELNNEELSKAMKTRFDQNIYDFDLGVVLHVSYEGIARTSFNEMAVNGVLPAHIEEVRTIGCELGQAFNERENEGEGTVPPDIVRFVERHCQPRP